MGASGGIFRTDNIGNQAQLLLTIGNSNTSFLTAGGAPNTAGELTFNANNAPINADQNGIVVASVITNNGTGVVTVTQSGVSTTQVNQASSYSGGTYVNSGRFRASTAGGMGTGPVYTAREHKPTSTPAATPTTTTISTCREWVIRKRADSAVATSESPEPLRVLAGTITLTGNSMISTRGNTGTPGAYITGQITGSFGPYFSGGTGKRWHSRNHERHQFEQQLYGRYGPVERSADSRGHGRSDSRWARGKGNLVMIGEGYLNGGAVAAGIQTHLNLNGNTETVNGLISNQGFEGHTSDPNFIVIDNSLSNSVGNAECQVAIMPARILPD